MSRKALYICLAISIVALSLIAAKKNQISAYYALPCCNWGTVVLPASGEFTAIQNLSLPAGNYVANATAALAYESTSDLSVDCVFMLDGAMQGEVARMTIGSGVNQLISLPLTTAFTIEKSKELTVACRTFGWQVASQPTSITAIRVDNLTVQVGFEP